MTGNQQTLSRGVDDTPWTGDTVVIAAHWSCFTHFLIRPVYAKDVVYAAAVVKT